MTGDKSPVSMFLTGQIMLNDWVETSKMFKALCTLKELL